MKKVEEKCDNIIVGINAVEVKKEEETLDNWESLMNDMEDTED